MSTGPESFSTRFNHAMRVHDMSVEKLSAELGAWRLSVPAAALEAWRTGQSLPVHESWRPIISRCESLLNLPPNTLLESLDADIEALHATGGDNDIDASGVKPAQRTLSSSRKHFEELDQQLDWSNEAERKIIEEDFIVSADFRTITQKVAIVARQVGLNRSTLHISTHYDEDQDPNDPKIHTFSDLTGATVVDTILERADDSLSRTRKLLLPPGKLGDFHRVEYVQVTRTPNPVSATPGRIFAWPLFFYRCSIHFEGPVPAQLQWSVTHLGDGSSDEAETVLTRPLHAEGSTATASIEHPNALMCAVSWTL